MSERHGDSPLERNLRGLFQRAYRPIEASPRFREELRARILDEADRVRLDGVRRGRARLRRLALAASLLLVAGAALYFFVAKGSQPASRPASPVAQKRTTEIESLADARTVDVPVGRLELSPRSLLGIRETGDSSFALDLRRGEARLHRDDATGLAALRMDDVEVAPMAGGGQFDLWLARTREGETMKWNRVLIPAGVGVGALVVYLAVRDGAVEMRTPHGREIVLPSETVASVANRPPARLSSGEAATSVAERSTRGTLSGFVRDGGGRPISGGRVDAGRLENAKFVATDGASSSTDAAGAFTVQVDAGAWRLRASADGFATRVGDDVRVDAGATVDGLVFELVAGSTVAGRAVDDSGQPLEGALVSARLQDTSGGDRPTLTVSTDATGAYVVSGLAENGVYAMTATKADHESAQTLNVRSHSEGVNFTLNRLAGIAGRVADDADLAPIAAFRVTVQREEASYNPPKPVSRDVESADGSFRILGIEPGTYCLFASAPGYATRQVMTIEVAPAKVTDGVLARLEKGGAVRGRVVVRGTGEPVAGAVIYSFRDLPPRSFEASAGGAPEEPGDYRTVSGADGTFELPHVSEGAHSLGAEHREFAPDRQVAVEVKAGAAVEGVTLQLSGGGSIAGTATNESNAPIEGAVIFTIELGREPRESFIRSTLTDASGHYEIARLMPSHYIVGFLPSAHSEDYDMYKNASTTVADGKTSTVDFRATTVGARLFGSVADTKGKGIAQIFVTAVRVGGTSNAASDIQFKSGVTDADGHYEVKDLKAGNYAIYLQKGVTMSFVYVGFVLVGSSPEDIHKDYVFSDASISGVARDAATGAPLGRASVIINVTVPGSSNPFFGGRTTTDPSTGAFTFNGLVPASYSLVVIAPGYGQETVDKLVLTADQVVSNLEFRLERGGTLLVRVADGNGSPLGGVFVIVTDSKGVSVADMSAMPKTNPSGEYAIPGIKPGHYSIRTFLTGAPPVVQAVDVTSGEQTVATITLETPADPAAAPK